MVDVRVCSSHDDAKISNTFGLVQSQRYSLNFPRVKDPQKRREDTLKLVLSFPFFGERYSAIYR